MFPYVGIMNFIVDVCGYLDTKQGTSQSVPLEQSTNMLVSSVFGDRDGTFQHVHVLLMKLSATFAALQE